MSIFVIVAIIIVAVVVAFVAFRNGKIYSIFGQGTSGYTLEQYTEEINSQFMNCFENESKNALNFVGQRGGYYKNEGKTIKTTTGFIPYYIFSDEAYFVNKSLVEQSISYYVNDMAKECVPKDYNRLLEINTGEAESRVRINNESVYINLNMPLVIERGNESKKIDKFDLTVSSNLSSMINIANWLSGEYKNDSEMFCISCLDKISQKNGVYIVRITLNSTDSLISIVSMDNLTYPERFNIAHKYKIGGIK